MMPDETIDTNKRLEAAWNEFRDAIQAAFVELKKRDAMIEKLRGMLEASRYPDDKHRPALPACDGIRDSVTGECICSWPLLNVHIDRVLKETKLGVDR